MDKMIKLLNEQEAAEGNTIFNLLNTVQLLQAYERAVNANIISSITDNRGIIVHANKKFCEVSKYSPDES